jgi:6,7-dimethyl-8-ribityllumazine synthase
MNVDPRERRILPTGSGGMSASGYRFGLVVSRFNETVTSRLLEGALDALRKDGAKETDLEVFHVPGAFEIPVTALQLGESGRFDAILCIGAVIRGETPHFDYICSAVSRGIMQVSLETGMPVIFGVLTADTPEQAMERAGLRYDKGREAALSAIEMANLFKNLEKR